jgi:lysophospholipase L1-like esterase
LEGYYREKTLQVKKISPETLKKQPWHEFQAALRRSNGTRGRLAAQIVVPLVVIALFLAVKAVVMAGVVAGVAVLMWLVCGFSPAGRRRVDRILGVFAHWVGQVVATVLLVPVFFVIMTLVRLVNRLTGSDPLQLRNRDAPTFWLPSDTETRRARYVKSMFCTERLARGRFALLPLVTLGVVLLLLAEVGLRLYGFGTPLLYVQDPDVGFYPQPHQHARQPGRIISINNYGMRSPDVAPHKTPGHIRILLLGDSTLAGTRVSNDELYSSLLEKKLNAAAGAPVFEVLNMGVNAWGPFHELAFVKKFGTFDADIAVICGPVYDCYRPLYGLDRMAFSPASGPPRFALEQVLYVLCAKYRDKCLGPPPWAQGERARAQSRLGIEAYAELALLLRQQGAEVLVEMLPTAQETLGGKRDAGTRQLVDLLAQRFEQLGVPMSCAECIFKNVKPAAKVYYDTAHFNRLGHRLYADYLAGRLRKTSSRLKTALGDS